MKISKIISCIIIIGVLTVLCTACEKSKSGEPNKIEQHIIDEFAKRGVSPGMSEEEVMAIEKIEFTLDSTLSYITADGTAKYFYSEDYVDYEGQKAILKYTFINDALCYIEYEIPVEYPASEIFSEPAYSLYLDYSMKYAELLGEPNDSKYEEYSSFRSYGNVWTENEDEYLFMIYCSQDKYDSFTDEYSNNVSLHFAINPEE